MATANSTEAKMQMQTIGGNAKSTEHAVWAHLPARPWKYVGMTVEKYQACQGAPIQPGACCDHCGTGIMDTHHFVAANTGERFRVGSTCVTKMLKEMRTRSLTAAEAAIKRAKRVAARARRERQTADAKAACRDLIDSLRDVLAARPHSHSWHASQGLTGLDEAEWLLRNGGLPAAKSLRNWLTKVAGQVQP